MTVRDATDGAVLKLHHYAEQLLTLQRQVDHHYEQYRRVKGGISRASRQQIEAKKQAFIDCRSTYQHKLADLLVKLRSGTLDDAEFLSGLAFDELVRSHDACLLLKDKINLLNLALERGCQLVDELQTPSLLPSRHAQDQQRVYLLYISDRLISTKQDEWKRVQKEFFELIGRLRSEALYYIIDYDLHPDLASEASSFLVEHYRGTRLTRNEDFETANPLEKVYCDTCGAEDHEERFVVLAERQRAWPLPFQAENLQRMDVKLSHHSKTMTLDRRKTSRLKLLEFQYYETLSVGNYRRYSTSKHRIEFEVLDFHSPIGLDLSEGSMDGIAFEITIGAIGKVLPWFTEPSKRDVYELIINCDERNVELIHQRIGSRTSLKIDPVRHPFPWKFRFCQDGFALKHCFAIVIRMKQVN